MRNTVKILLFTVATLSLGLGILGVFIPLLPTTPFLLLAAFCYARSSERFYRWLINNRLLGTYLRNYTEGKGMPFRMKLIIILLLWVTIGISIAFGVHNTAIRVILFCIAAGVTFHVVRVGKGKRRTGDARKGGAD